MTTESSIFASCKRLLFDSSIKLLVLCEVLRQRFANVSSSIWVHSSVEELDPFLRSWLLQLLKEKLRENVVSSWCPEGKIDFAGEWLITQLRLRLFAKCLYQEKSIQEQMLEIIIPLLSYYRWRDQQNCAASTCNEIIPIMNRANWWVMIMFRSCFTAEKLCWFYHTVTFVIEAIISSLW